MAKIEKSVESGPQLFFDFTWKYVPRLFLVAPWAEKMTISQKTGRVWFEDTYFLNPWCLPVNLPYWSPLVTSLKLFYTSRPMCFPIPIPVNIKYLSSDTCTDTVDSKNWLSLLVGETLNKNVHIKDHFLLKMMTHFNLMVSCWCPF